MKNHINHGVQQKKKITFQLKRQGDIRFIMLDQCSVFVYSGFIHSMVRLINILIKFNYVLINGINRFSQYIICILFFYFTMCLVPPPMSFIKHKQTMSCFLLEFLFFQF